MGMLRWVPQFCSLNMRMDRSPQMAVVPSPVNWASRFWNIWRPEITIRPQSSTIYAGQNASYSVAAEGKYLTYIMEEGRSWFNRSEINTTHNSHRCQCYQRPVTIPKVVGNQCGSVESRRSRSWCKYYTSQRPGRMVEIWWNQRNGCLRFKWQWEWRKPDQWAYLDGW